MEESSLLEASALVAGGGLLIVLINGSSSSALSPTFSMSSNSCSKEIKLDGSDVLAAVMVS